jgi:hypothetical protein
MLGKATMKGFELTDVNGDPCPHQILRSMGGLRKSLGLNQIGDCHLG